MDVPHILTVEGFIMTYCNHDKVTNRAVLRQGGTKTHKTFKLGRYKGHCNYEKSKGNMYMSVQHCLYSHPYASP